MSRKTVSALLIEQDRSNASHVQRLVAETGDACSLSVAESFAAALDIIHAGEIDIVLLGIRLPGPSALLDTLRNVRAKLPQSIPILVISDHDDQQEALHALRSGAQDHLIKGEFDGRSLLRSMLYAIERQKTREELSKACVEVEQTKELLRQSERKFRAIFDRTFQMTGLLSPDGTVLQANRTAVDFVGISEADVLGKPIWEAPWWAHSEAQQEKVHSGVTRAANGAFVRFETDLVTLDGKVRHFDCSLTPVTDETGRVVLIIPEARDITERIVAEKALWESTQMFKLVLDNMPAFVFWKDRNGVYLGCNHLFAANAGLKSAEEIVGKTDLDLPWKNTEAPGYRAVDRAVMESGTPKINYEETQRTADGRTMDVRTSKIPLRSPEGEVIGVLGAFEDITERKRAEQRLAEAEAKYRCLVEESLVGVYLIQEGRLAYANSCMAQLFGYSQEELIGRPVEELVVEEDRPLVVGNVRKREMGEAATIQYTFRGLRKNGQAIDVDVIGTRTSYNGNQAVIGTMLDITERKRADEALRESEAKYRRIVDTANEGVLVLDREGSIQFANARMAGILGCAIEKVNSANLSDYLFEDDLPDHYGKLENRRKGISETYERRFRREDGRAVWTIASAVPISDDEHKFAGSFAMYTDITERKLAEEALQEERMLFIGGPVVAFRWKATEGWPVEYVSPNIFEQFGYRPEDLTSGRILYADIVHPDDLPRLISEVNAYCAAKVPCCELEYRIARADGQHRWVYDFTVVIRDSSGAVTHFHGHLSDITDRKRAEEEQARLRQHLHQAQKMEAVGHLAGGIAHDFNNILGIINGYSELLLQDSQLTKESRDYADEILTAGERAASLTRQLLAFSRKLMLKPKVLSLNAVISGLDRMLRRLIGEEVEVRMVLAPDLDFVKADPGQMEQVLLNFCINARDAMPEGGTITIETTNVEVDEATAVEHFNMAPGRYVRVMVSDTGSGMDEHTLSHIFEPFFTTKGPERGTGLGLATVYGIVKQSGGHVWASSTPGKETRFFVCLPTVTQEAENQYKEKTSQEAFRGSETILLVEDAAPLRALFRRHLEDNGYSVLEAEDGERAIQISDSFEGSIPLLLTDVALPKIRGSALSRILQQRRPGIRVLFVSGYTDTAIAPEGEMQVGTAFLQKPFTAEALVRKIRELLDSRPGVMDKGSSPDQSSDYPRLNS